MSKIDEMIRKLCPNGVEYKTLGEVGTFERGRRFVKADAVEKGTPCIHYGELYTYYGISATEVKSHINPNLKTKLRYAEKNDVVIVGAGENNIDIGIAVAWLGDFKVAIHDACYIFRHKENPKYISYFMRTESYHKQIKKYVSEGKICSISADGISKAIIPVPPLEIQEEIVNILDKFTELTAELTAELAARKKQYEFYRDALLSFGKVSPPLTFSFNNEEVRWMTLGEITTISRGVVISKDFIRDNAGEYPVYSSQTENNGCLGCINTYKYDGEYLTWTTDGANAGTVFYRTGKFSITNVCGLIKNTDSTINLKYIYYILSVEAPKYVNRGMGNAKLMSNVMATIKIPIPPLAVQERIVTILDEFDSLLNDLTKGLPAEIEARKKQYEYYREQLLTFKKAG